MNKKILGNKYVPTYAGDKALVWKRSDELLWIFGFDDDMSGREESSVPLRQSYIGQNHKITG